MSKTARFRNQVRRSVGMRLGVGGTSWVKVAHAVLRKENKPIPDDLTKGAARTIVLRYGGAANIDKIRQPRKTAPVSKYKKDSKAFFSSDRWKELRYQALKNCGAKCLCCGISAHDGAVLHVDHIKPRYHYPELQWALENLQVLCSDCNLGKRAWDETDWRTDAMRENMAHMKAIKDES